MGTDTNIPCKEYDLRAVDGYGGSSEQDFSPFWKGDTFAVGFQFNGGNWIVVAECTNFDGGLFGFPAIPPIGFHLIAAGGTLACGISLCVLQPGRHKYCRRLFVPTCAGSNLGD